MQIIPRGPNFWGDLGSNLGELAGFKLAELTKAHQQKQERSQFAENFAPILGNDTANFLSNLSPEERKSALQNISSLVQLNQPPSSQQQATQLGGLSSPQQLQQFGQQQMPGEPQQQQPSQQVNPERAQILEDIFTSPHEKREREKLSLKKQQIAAQERLAGFKETKADRTAILNDAKGAKDNLARLDRMGELSKHGKLSSPLYLDFLKKTGFDIPALTTPDSEEFRKLEVDFLRDAKSIFGARVTSYEVAQFLKSIPSLSQSKQGRERVIKNLKIMNEGKLVRAQALRDVLKENNGTPPLDLAEQVEDKASPKIDKLLNEFRLGKSSKSFNDLPPASQYNGQKIRDKESGKILQSNGQKWLPVE